jgi:hypothetical protein
MTAIGLAARRSWHGTARWAVAFGPWRMAVVALLLALGSTSGAVAGIMIQALADAFLQVTVFVAATLAIFYGLESWLRLDVPALLARHRAWQVPIAAALGALPGCGGAVMVITQYIRGGIGFGSVIAVLTSTMGDAAFLVLAQKPTSGLALIASGFVIGTLSGYAVEKIHGAGFMRHDGKGSDASSSGPCFRRVESRAWRWLWFALLVPGLVLGGFVAFQADTAALIGAPFGVDIALWVGGAGAIVSMLLWGYVRPVRAESGGDGERPAALGWASASEGRLSDAPARVVGDTCFVTVWVIFAYLIYELGVHFSGVDLGQLFRVWAPLVPLMAILVGFLPGCGPQVVVATLYVGGIVPFSAELGNAISNDGDALFPAIAMAPRAAIVATLYSAVPAFICAYGYYWLFE